MWELLGDVFIFLGFRSFANLGLAVISFMTAIFYITFHLAEENRLLIFTDYFIKLNNGKFHHSDIKLTEKNYLRFCSQVKTPFYFLYYNVVGSTLVFGFLLLFFLGIWALNQEEYHFDWLLVLIWSSITLFLGVMCAGIGVIQVLLFYMSTLYIRYRFEQVKYVVTEWVINCIYSID
jgi:hypothetical protein